MMIGCYSLICWLCTPCGHIWPCRPSYKNDKPLRCPMCRTRSWDAPPPDDPCGELPGA